MEGDRVGVCPACGADRARASGRRRRRTTISSSPPCACSCARPARSGCTGWAMSDTPEAQKRGSSSAPGICLRNSGANSPCTVEVWMPAFSNTRPFDQTMAPPPPARRRDRCGSRACARNAPAGRSPKRRLSGSSASRRSKAAGTGRRAGSRTTRARAFCAFDVERMRHGHLAVLRVINRCGRSMAGDRLVRLPPCCEPPRWTLQRSAGAAAMIEISAIYRPLTVARAPSRPAAAWIRRPARGPRFTCFSHAHLTQRLSHAPLPLCGSKLQRVS